MGLLDGVLPAVYSAGNKLKRQVGGLLSDPVGTVQQQIGLLNDKAGAFNQLHSQATQDAVNAARTGAGIGPAQQRIAGTLADAYNPIGMVVWHGSPHKFTKFDSSKIGTGEGAQAYGHGLYLAESDEVARGYQTKLSGGSLVDSRGVPVDPTSTTADLERKLRAAGLSWDEAEKAATGWSSAVFNGKTSELHPIVQQEIKAAGLSPKNTGSLYKVDLPDDAIAKMLDWDKPLSQQAPEVQTALQNSGLMKYADEYFKTNRKAAPTGADLHDFLKYSGYDQGELAAKMAEQGLPGIRYLDGGSRGAGSGTSNFVVFPGNEGLLSILERNGQPIK